MSGLISRIAAPFVLAMIFANPAVSRSPDVASQTRAFLNAYAKGDRAAVLGMIDPSVTAYGSDISEIAHGVAGVALMLDADRRLWGGPARIGEMRDVSMASGGDLAALTFDAPFELAGRPAVMVRFSMVWRRDGHGWRLVQSVNSTPTVGQSADELLKGAAK